MGDKKTFEDGEVVIFDTQNMVEELTECSDLTEKDIKNLHGKNATIECLATYNVLGNKDYEYYDIKFENSTVLDALSGYHLKSTKNETEEDFGGMTFKRMLESLAENLIYRYNDYNHSWETVQKMAKDEVKKFMKKHKLP